MPRATPRGLLLHALGPVLAGLAVATALTGAAPPPWPTSFDATGPDRAAIEGLLATYARAVSTKDEAAFDSLLVDPHITFSSAGAAIRGAARLDGARNYAAFRAGVFAGPPFTQTFHDVHIMQDGLLATVSLVFTNTAPDGRSGWGWKTMQLLKIDGQWRIASEFYTGHRFATATRPLPTGDHIAP